MHQFVAGARSLLRSRTRTVAFIPRAMGPFTMLRVEVYRLLKG